MAAELELLLVRYGNATDLKGRQALICNGHLPERSILTGLREVPVRVPKVRDRSGSGIKFNSAIVPPSARKARRVEAAPPWLYLRGISTGDMREALSVLLGEEGQVAPAPRHMIYRVATHEKSRSMSGFQGFRGSL